MAIEIAAELTPQGLLIPTDAVQEWLAQGIHIVKEKQRIVIEPQPKPRTERERVLEILRASGRLAAPEWEPSSPPVSDAELAELAKKFSVGRPLSEIIIEERD